MKTTPPPPSRLLVLSMNFSPELTGIGKYSGEMVQGLLERGHEVTVVCAPPYYPAWQLGAGRRGWALEQPQPGLTLLRCPLWVPAHPNALRRLVHQASFALSSLPVLLAAALWQRPAVVMAVAPATFCAPAAWLAARLSGARAWLHVQDLELDAAFALGLLHGRWLRAAALAVESRLLRGFDHVSTISRRMLRQLACKGVDLARASLLPNWVNPALMSATPAEREGMRSELGVAPGQTLLLFAGTMNRKQGLEVLLQAAALLRERDDIVFVLSGAGEMKPVLQAQAARAGLTNLCFAELQPETRLPALLAAADIHLLPQLRGAADLVLPSKLGGMLASGRPVIAAAEAGSEVHSLVQHCGTPVAPEDAAAFAAAIGTLSQDADLRRQLGDAARRLAEHTLAREALLDRLAIDLAALVQGPAPAPAWNPGSPERP